MSRAKGSSGESTRSDTEERGAGTLGVVEALRMKELQLRELQHRVKNTMHLLGTLLRSAEREVAQPEAKAKIREVATKVAAIGALERLIYESPSHDRIEMLGLARAVAGTVMTSSGRETQFEISGDRFHIKPQAATTLALIINELLTNCVKHAQTKDHRLRIGVDFGVRGGWLELSVHDNGTTPYGQQDVPSGSGIGLIRGLAHQLGGSMAIEQNEGTRCVVGLPAASLT